MKIYQPTTAYIGASWFVLVVGILAYLVGLWNAEMQLNEKGYYFTVLSFGIYSAISLQKSVRDQAEGIQTSQLYHGISWTALITAICLLSIGLYNASMVLTEKGFYFISFTMTLFSAITIQKNIRDLANFNAIDHPDLQKVVHRNTKEEHNETLY